MQNDDYVTDYVTHSYTVGPERYVNDRVAIGPRVQFGSQSSCRLWLEETCPAPDSVRVYYDPARPEESVLRRGISLTLATEFLIAVACVALALLGVSPGD